MNMNAMRIEINNDHSKICYIENGDTVCQYHSPVGMSYMTENRFSRFSASVFMSYVDFCLHSLRHIRQVPNVFHIDVHDNKISFENMFLKNNYTQLWGEDIAPRVIMSLTTSAHPNYERHKKTLHKFKV